MTYTNSNPCTIAINTGLVQTSTEFWKAARSAGRNGEEHLAFLQDTPAMKARDGKVKVLQHPKTVFILILETFNLEKYEDNILGVYASKPIAEKQGEEACVTWLAERIGSLQKDKYFEENRELWEKDYPPSFRVEEKPFF